MDKNKMILSVCSKYFSNKNRRYKECINTLLQGDSLYGEEFVCSSLYPEKISISLQFFSDDDSDDDSDGEEVNEANETGEENSSQSAGSVEKGNNPVVAAARKKAQGVYDKSGAKDKINSIGEKAGDKTKDASKKLGDAVGGKVGKGINAAGNVAGDKMSKAGDSLGNKIGGGNDQKDKTAGESVADKAKDAAENAVAKGAGKAVEAGMTAAGVPGGKLAAKATEEVTKKALKNEKVKSILKIGGLGCLGIVVVTALVIFVPIILLYAFGAEVLLFLLGLFQRVAAGFLWIVTLGNYNMNNLEMINNKLEGIYRERGSTVTEVDEDGNTVEVTNDPDLEFSADLQKNIDRERMKRYVQSEISSILYIAEDDDGDGVADKKHEVDIAQVYNIMAEKEANGSLSTGFWNKLFDSYEGKTFDSIVVESGIKEEYDFDIDNLEIDFPGDLAWEGRNSLENWIKNDLKAIESKPIQTEGDKADLPEGLEEILDYIPTAEGYFAPLEDSMGNSAIYRGEEKIIKYTYKNPQKDEYGYIMEPKKDENGEIIEPQRFEENDELIDPPYEVLSKEEPDLEEGEVVTGNPPLFKFKLPKFFSDGGKNKNLLTDFEDSEITRAFVLDIARLSFDNPKWREEDEDWDSNKAKPFTITAQVLFDTTESVEEFLFEGNKYHYYNENMTLDADFRVPVKKITTKTVPTIAIVKVEMWDKKIEYSYKKITEDPIVEVLPDGRTITTNHSYYEELENTITPSGYAEQFISDYQLEEHDFGIYEEITGEKYFLETDEYINMSNEEYTESFLQSGYASPLNNLIVTSQYGYRSNPFGGSSGEFHHGVDFSGNKGDPVYSIAEGKVVKADKNGTASSYGKYVVVEYTNSDGSKFYAYYAHLSYVSVNAGDTVKIGQRVGLVGSTGRSTGPHLHFEIRTKFPSTQAGNTVNPMDYLNSKPLDTSE